MPTAKRIWDLLLTETIVLNGPTRVEAASEFEMSSAAATLQGEQLFSEMRKEHRDWLKAERERAQYAFDARYQAIGRIGLPAVREHRRKRLDSEHNVRLTILDDAETTVPDLNAVMMLRIGKWITGNDGEPGARAP